MVLLHVVEVCLAQVIGGEVQCYGKGRKVKKNLHKRVEMINKPAVDVWLRVYLAW